MKLYKFARIIAFTGIILTGLTIITNNQFPLLIYGFFATGALIVTTGFVTIFILIKEYRIANLSKIKRYRVLFLIFSISFIVIDGLSIVLYFVANLVLDDTFFILWWSAIERTSMLVGAIIFMYISLLMPKGLQERLGLLPIINN
ncbi:MAG: hypothetical protein HeimC3_22550 [Candidatus Heimdallarchaeota archaeon LC_3]|nr:MAG: hypothetical protein HeimC3_22550 [Candidatus Heimdallarchaeota archaeon LC_3]